MSSATSIAVARRPLDVVRDYLSLGKFKIVVLLVATAFLPMVAAAHGLPTLAQAIAVLAGGTLSSAGAHAINCWFDRDIDRLMQRTRNRPLPAGRIPAWHALALGILANAAAFAVLALLANVLAGALAMAGSAIYVFVYTLWLKRSTPQNIVIGGAAGAIPPLVGWSAVTGRLDLTAISLFLVIFFWTPPHFWALAQMISKDYERASVPMMPGVAGKKKTQRQSIVYAVLTLAVSLIPFFTHAEGWVYLAGASVLGVGLCGLTLLDIRGRGWTRRLFGYSSLYLAVLFVVLAVGAVLV
ncbi:MAG: heme o synthase [Candidatus Dormibacteraceae bacterium]